MIINNVLLTVSQVSRMLLCIALIMLCVLAAPQLSQAQNKVVVIPLFGDDAELEPTAPVTKVDPNPTDYTIGALTVIDNITGLEWQRDFSVGVDSVNDWTESLDYCADLTLDGKTDWRLPELIELQSIVDYGDPLFLIDITAFPPDFPGPSSGAFWTATSLAGDSSAAWMVNFDSARFETEPGFPSLTSSNRKSVPITRIRCVR